MILQSLGILQVTICIYIYDYPVQNYVEAQHLPSVQNASRAVCSHPLVSVQCSERYIVSE